MNTEISHSEVEKKEDQEDIFYGQIVFIWARWVVISSALFLILFKADSVCFCTARHLFPHLSVDGTRSRFGK